MDNIGVTGGFSPGMGNAGKRIADIASKAIKSEMVQKVASDVLVDASARAIGMSPNTARAVVDGVVGAMVNATQAGGDNFIRVGSNSSDGKGKGFDGGSGRAGSLDYNPNPIEVRLDTGIQVNAYTDYYYDYNSNFSPMYMVGGQIQIPTSSQDLANFFNDVVSFQFTNALQRAVSFSIDTSLVSGATLVQAMNYLLNALQIYLFFDSVISYTSSPLNRNQAMLDIRNNLSAGDINALNNLRWILAGTPIPPNMKSICYYLTQTYKISSLAGSPIIKICPAALDDETGQGNFFPDGGQIQDAINNLYTCRSTFSLIGRACPSWFNGYLPSSNAYALHDPNFNTIFFNTPSQYTNVNGVQLNIPSTVDGALVYGTYTTELDGGAFALTSIWDNVNGFWLPSLWSPLPSATSTPPTTISNRWVYYNSSLILGQGNFVDIYSFPASVFRSPQFSYFIYGTDATTYDSYIPFGSESLEGVTPDAVFQTSLKLTEWMMSLDSIGMIKDNRVYGVPQPNRGGKQKSYRNKRGK